MAQDLTAELFQPLIGSQFSMSTSGGPPFAVELIEVTLLEAHEGPRRQPFSLVFADPRKSVALLQQTFRVEHEKLGGVDLFLVPIGPAPQGMRYEAVFN